ncbi:MAG: putative glycolipid-binding domain-containing protein, partial [Rhodospirillales bacterium]|nr:putative glycolipid-binding domain-containing protein [Rhodospirillales bacterium]
MRRDIVWQRLDRPGLEHVALEVWPDFVRAESFVLLQLDEGLARLGYTLACDGAWRTRRIDLALTIGTAERRLDLRRDAEGTWTANGAARPDLAPCFEIDLAATPLTNTLALKRLDLVEGEPRRMQAAYITVPELQVRVDEQEYTLLSAMKFRYRGLSTNFEAEVTND